MSMRGCGRTRSRSRKNKVHAYGRPGIAGRALRQRAEKHDIEFPGRSSCTPRPEPFAGRILLLRVMIDAGPYSEQAELRLRTRQAVLRRFERERLYPDWMANILDMSRLRGRSHRRGVAALPMRSTTSLLIPWEQCEAMDDLERVFPAGTARIVVLWLPASNFSPCVLKNFAALIDKLTQPFPSASAFRHKIDITLLGPANSTGLQSMVREVRATSLSKATQAALDGVSIISPRATAPDAMLLYEPSPRLIDLERHGTRIPFLEEITLPRAPMPLEQQRTRPDLFPPFNFEKAAVTWEGTLPEPPWPAFLRPEPTVRELLEQSVARGPRGGLHFFRSIATDKLVLQELLAELKRRWQPAKIKQKGASSWKASHIVVLSEWDTPYGRSLNTTFVAEASDQYVNEIIEQKRETTDSTIGLLARQTDEKTTDNPRRRAPDPFLSLFARNRRSVTGRPCERQSTGNGARG